MKVTDITAIHDLVTLEDGEILRTKVMGFPATGVARDVQAQFLARIDKFITLKLTEMSKKEKGDLISV